MELIIKKGRKVLYSCKDYEKVQDTPEVAAAATRFLNEPLDSVTIKFKQGQNIGILSDFNMSECESTTIFVK